jgi:hypothetical protein
VAPCAAHVAAFRDENRPAEVRALLGEVEGATVGVAHRDLFGVSMICVGRQEVGRRAPVLAPVVVPVLLGRRHHAGELEAPALQRLSDVGQRARVLGPAGAHRRCRRTLLERFADGDPAAPLHRARQPVERVFERAERERGADAEPDIEGLRLGPVVERSTQDDLDRADQLGRRQSPLGRGGERAAELEGRDVHRSCRGELARQPPPAGADVHDAIAVVDVEVVDHAAQFRRADRVVDVEVGLDQFVVAQGVHESARRR